MTIPVTCPCGQAYTVPDEYAGKRGKCRACGQVVVVPQPLPPEPPKSLFPRCAEVHAAATIPGPAGQVRTCAFSRDGQLLVVANQLGALSLCQAADGELLKTWLAYDRKAPAEGQRPFPAALSPDGTLLATVSHDQLRVWSVPVGKELLSANTHPRFEPVHSVSFLADGKGLVTASRKCVTVWTVFCDPRGHFAGARERDLVAMSEDGPELCTSVAVSPDGQRLVTVGTTHGALSVKLRDVSAPGARLLRPLFDPDQAGVSYGVYSPATFAPDGRSVVIAPLRQGEPGGIISADVATGQRRPLPCLPLGRTTPGLIPFVSYTASGKYLVIAELEPGTPPKSAAPPQSVLRVFHPAEERDLVKVPPEAVTAWAVSPRGEALATGLADGTVKLWRPGRPKQ